MTSHIQLSSWRLHVQWIHVINDTERLCATWSVINKQTSGLTLRPCRKDSHFITCQRIHYSLNTQKCKYCISAKTTWHIETMMCITTATDVAACPLAALRCLTDGGQASRDANKSLHPRIRPKNEPELQPLCSHQRLQHHNTRHLQWARDMPGEQPGASGGRRGHQGPPGGRRGPPLCVMGHGSGRV